MKRVVVLVFAAVTLLSPPAMAQITIAAASPIEDGLVLSFSGTPEDGAEGLRIFAEPAASGCEAANLIPGEVPAPALAVSQRSTLSLDDLEVSLEADVRYALGVATFDADDNLGPLSPLVCATPLGFAPLSTGSSGCSVQPEGSKPWGWLWLMALVLARRQFKSRAKGFRVS